MAAVGVVGFGIMEKDVRSLMGWRTSFVVIGGLMV